MLEVDEDSRLGRELLGGGGRYHAASAPSDEMVADFYLEAVDLLSLGGFPQYEISNFARPGKKSRHNRKYWQRQPYLGFGLDAHSMLRTAHGEAIRFRTGEDLAAFLGGTSWQAVEPVSSSQALEEAWFLGLRLNEGVSIKELEPEFGAHRAHRYDAEVGELEALGLLERRAERVALTSRGRLMSNEVFGRFLSDAAASDAELVLVD